VLLAHEAAFGGFLALTALRLALVAGPLDVRTLLFGGLAAAEAAVILLCRRRESRRTWLIRLFFFPAAMLVAYAALGPAMDAIQPARADGLLEGVDLLLVGGNLSLLLEPCASPLLTELMVVAYGLFFPYLGLSLLHHARRDLDTAKRLFAGAFTVYGIGFLGYTLLPAAGPWVALADRFAGPLEGGPLTALHDWIVVNGTNGVDVFPSLHCALTAFLLFFDRLHDPARYRRWLPWVALLWTSTIYLRYHYFVDVLAGFALAFGALALAGALPRRPEALPRPGA
jgi:membrane-associated phospholipid phosphatase